PFAGGGALPLEAQRLGLESYASDLNPVAVLINKAMIEIPPKFAGQPPVNPESRAKTGHSGSWKGAQGLAEDVRFYGQWMRDEAEKRIGHLYPKIEVTPAMVRERPDLKPYEGKHLTVIAWLWARTVKSPNPAFREVAVPLASTFMLSTKTGKEAYVEPVIENGQYRFTVKEGKPKNAAAAKEGTSAGKRAAFKCVMSGTPLSYDYIRTEGQAGRMGARLMAIVAEGVRSRVYLSPTDEMEAIANSAQPTWKPDTNLPINPRDFKTPNYGMNSFADLFTPRQLVALTTFSDLVLEARERVLKDALAAGMIGEKGKSGDGSHALLLSSSSLSEGGTGAAAYADAVAVYLGFLINQVSNHSSSVCGWNSANSQMRSVFARQAIPMVWDYAESNPLCDSSGSYSNLIDRSVKGFGVLGHCAAGVAAQADAVVQHISSGKLISTDPPYYDNIGYADLSDFFYVWLRRTLKGVFPNSFSTLAVPKEEELVATPYRHGSKEKAEAFFLDGMTKAMRRLTELAHPEFPTTIYYAYKQTESEDGDSGEQRSTGWDTFLEAVFHSGFLVCGTWPIRTEKQGRVIGNDRNALASSIVIVCRKRATEAPTATRREFVNALKAELPPAMANLQRGNIAPVDLAQAAIGPGMAVFTRYSRVLDAEGKGLSVREALSLINQTLDEALAEQEGDFDADTRWALAWFEQNGFADGEFGVAETLSKAKNTSVAGLVESGLLASGKGKVRLLRPEELPANWDPATDTRLSVWEAVHHLVRAHATGEDHAATLMAKLGTRAEPARELAYRLYNLCERKKRPAEALAYNALVQSWPGIVTLAKEAPKGSVQAGLFDTN
ncbi:MAG: DUF1156 domain-containing protein, partial [Calditrichaeota bacterium]|nr:DUF1156 domain-containing protein [Calditrichota bacterium]